MDISKLVKKEFSYLEVDETLASAAKKMAKENISELPVVKEWKFIGIIKFSEIAGSMVNNSFFQKPSIKDPKKVQNQKIIKHIQSRRMGLKPENDMATLLNYIKKNNAEIVPILDSQMRIVGVIYLSDVQKEISRILSEGTEDASMLSSLLQSPERIKGQTPIDQLVNLVEKKGSVKMSEAAKICGLSHSEIQDYAKSLEKSNLIRIEYGFFGMKLTRPEKPKQGN